MLLEIIFRDIFFVSSVLANCVRGESCRGDFPPTYAEGVLRVAQTDFCVYK